mgnify:CR=1 FL=1
MPPMQTPQITLVVISSEGVLCGSTQSGEIDDLVKYSPISHKIVLAEPGFQVTFPAGSNIDGVADVCALKLKKRSGTPRRCTTSMIRLITASPSDATIW